MKIRICVLLLVLVLGLLIATEAQAYKHFYSSLNGDTHSGTPGDGMLYQGNLGYGGFNVTDPLYINSGKWDTGGVDWESEYGITFYDNPGTGYNNTYNYGTALNPGDYYNGYLFGARTTGTWGTPTPAGIYDASFILYGGATAASNDVLAQIPFRMEVVSGYDDFTLTLLDPIRSGVPGDKIEFSNSYVNNSNRTIYRNSDYISFWAGFDWSHISYDFLYNSPWTLAANTSGQYKEFSETINSGALIQNNLGDAGMYGGYYYGDQHQFSSGNYQINVVKAVPEPSSLTGLLIGFGSLCGFVVRRRRN